MSVLTFDTETTIKNKGNPFCQDNILCYIGLKENNADPVSFRHPFTDSDREAIQAYFDRATTIVAFNAKFDLHWTRKLGIDYSHCRLFDCQVAEFILTNQQERYPSLEGCLVKYGLGHKIDVIKEYFWSIGVDTIDINPALMVQYLYTDVNKTYELYLVQRELLANTGKLRLHSLDCQDLFVLAEMEWNGIRFDYDESLRREASVAGELEVLEKELRKGYEELPINFDSGDHLSCYLYGGTIIEETRVPVGLFKTGAKIGMPRYKIVAHEYVLPKLFEPIKGSALKKEGFFATNEDTLKKLRGTKESRGRVQTLLKRAELEKLRGTYYAGFPKIIDEMVWPKQYLHPTYNKCVAITGRLSSTKPNGQNMGPDIKQLCISRYS